RLSCRPRACPEDRSQSRASRSGGPCSLDPRHKAEDDRNGATAKQWERSELAGDADDGALLDDVELVAVDAATLHVIHRQGAIAAMTVEAARAVGAEVVVVSGDCLAGEAAADAEAAEVAAHEEAVRRRVVPCQLGTEKRIDPIDAAGAGERTLA